MPSSGTQVLLVVGTESSTEKVHPSGRGSTENLTPLSSSSPPQWAKRLNEDESLATTALWS